MRSSLEVLIVAAFTTFQLTRLVVRDSIFDRPRGWIVGRAPEWFVELITCPWCVSAYLAAGVVAVLNVSVSTPAPIVLWLSIWGMATLIYQWSATR